MFSISMLLYYENSTHQFLLFQPVLDWSSQVTGFENVFFLQSVKFIIFIIMNIMSNFKKRRLDYGLSWRSERSQRLPYLVHLKQHAIFVDMSDAKDLKLRDFFTNQDNYPDKFNNIQNNANSLLADINCNGWGCQGGDDFWGEVNNISCARLLSCTIIGSFVNCNRFL